MADNSVRGPERNLRTNMERPGQGFSQISIYKTNVGEKSRHVFSGPGGNRARNMDRANCPTPNSNEKFNEVDTTASVRTAETA